MTDKLCFFCDKQGIREDFDLDGLKMLSGFKLCKKDEEWCEARITELEKALPKKYSINAIKPNLSTFVPKQVSVKRNYQDKERPENGGELME